jgi:two-component system sensor histidine kinase DesK
MIRWLEAIHRRLLPPEANIGWIPYLILVYAGFFFLKYLFTDASTFEAVAVALTIPAFLLLYFNAYWRRGWQLVLTLVGLGLIGTAWAPHNFGANVFFIFACSFAGWIGPVQRAALAIAAIQAWTMLVAYFLQPQIPFWLPVLVFGTMAGMICIYDAGRARRAAELRLSQQEVRQMARVAERERISRDLHDLLGHTLSVIALKSELAGRLIRRDPERATAEIREVEQVSRAALAEVREAITGMRTRGLAGELEYARIALKAAGVELVVDGAPPELPPANEAVLAMVLREAATNVIRHAEASRCRIVIRKENGETFVEVHDDGRGGKPVAGGGSTACARAWPRSAGASRSGMNSACGCVPGCRREYPHRDRRGPGAGARRAFRIAGTRARHGSGPSGPQCGGGVARASRARGGRAAHRHRDAGHERARAGRGRAARASNRPRHHRHHLRPRRLPAASAKGRCGRLPAQGRTGD